MEQFVQKAAWVRRGTAGAVVGRMRNLGNKVRSRQWMVPATINRLARQFSSDITIRSLSSQKVIVTGTLSGRSLDLVACMQQDGSLEVKGYNGTLPTQLTTRLAYQAEVVIGGRRDGRRIQAAVWIGDEGLAQVREGSDETIAPIGIFEQMLSRIPSHMTALLRATMLYLMTRCAC